MTAREWKPGDVAMVRLDPETEIRVMFNGANWFGRKGTFYDLHASARPLAVIDTEDREQVERLRDLTVQALSDQIGYRAASDQAFTEGDLANAMQAALREFANPTPPKPEEPTGLGAVVEDAEGRRYVRTLARCLAWLDADDQDAGYDYAALSAVRVLSEGVTQ